MRASTPRTSSSCARLPGRLLAPRSCSTDRCPRGCEQKQFAWLYTVYSIPNTVLPFLGGFFVDKMSARLMNIVFCGCILVGQFIFAVGVFAGSFPIMIAGRVVFGLGGGDEGPEEADEGPDEGDERESEHVAGADLHHGKINCAFAC